MSQVDQELDLNTKIEEIKIEYDMSLAVSNEPSYGIGQDISSLLILPEESEYAVVTNVDRERSKRAYPKPSRAESHPQGEDLFVL